jgi:hypothetical protein
MPTPPVGFFTPRRRKAQVDPQLILNVAFSAAFATIGWFGRTIYSAIKSLETDLSNHKVEVAKNYVTAVDLARIEDKLDRALDRLYQMK